MLNTKKLYESDAYRTSFEGEIIGTTTVDGRPGVILDRTLFYPTGGGQPHDTGSIDGHAVVDVLEQDGAIVHIMDEPKSAGTVTGKIDRHRRFDHMQQHTGQHILSQAFVRGLNADTVGFHLGEKISTIDVAAPQLSWQDIHGIETEANGVVFANGSVRMHDATQETLFRFPLRKAPEVQGAIRIVEVADYDWSACCGTHVRTTGEIGLIKVVRFEKYKGDVRVTFVCGHRALSAMQAKTEIVEAAVRRLTLREEQLVDGIDRLLEIRESQQKTIKALEKQLLVKEVEEWLAGARMIGAFRFVTGTFADRDAKSVQTLGMQITGNAKTVCLFGVSSRQATIIVGQCEDGPLDLKGLTSYVVSLLDGKGGGNRRQIQVSSADGSRLAPAMEILAAHIDKEIRGG